MLKQSSLPSLEFHIQMDVSGFMVLAYGKYLSYKNPPISTCTVHKWSSNFRSQMFDSNKIQVRTE
jgi:hypothetical protein